MHSQNIEYEAREEEAGEFIECAEVYAGGAVGETGGDGSEAGGWGERQQSMRPNCKLSPLIPPPLNHTWYCQTTSF